MSELDDDFWKGLFLSMEEIEWDDNPGEPLRRAIEVFFPNDISPEHIAEELRKDIVTRKLEGLNVLIKQDKTVWIEEVSDYVESYYETQLSAALV